MLLRRMVAVATVAGLLTIDVAAVASAADPTYPTGTFTLGRTSVHLEHNSFDEDPPIARIVVTRSDLDDDTTAPADIVTSLDPGDGSGPSPWATSSDTWTLTYSSVGTFAPQARLTDADGNTTVVALPQVKVMDDLTGPTTRVTVPEPRQRARLSSWRVVRGTATDSGVGVNAVYVVVLQKRRGWWYYYRPFQGATWTKGLRTEAATFERFHPQGAEAVLSGSRWRSGPVRGLTRGPVVVRVSAVDRNLNFSRPAIARGTITRR